MVDPGTGEACGRHEPDLAALRRSRLAAAVERGCERLPLLRPGCAATAAAHFVVAGSRAWSAADCGSARPARKRAVGARGPPRLAPTGAATVGTTSGFRGVHARGSAKGDSDHGGTDVRWLRSHGA